MSAPEPPQEPPRTGPAAPGEPSQPESDVPVSEWAPEDPEVADVGYWGGEPVPTYAEPGSPEDAAIAKRQRRLLAGHDADHSTPLGQEALTIGRAGRTLDGLAEQLAATPDPSERYAIWQQMLEEAQGTPPAGQEPPQDPPPTAGKPPTPEA